MSEVGSLLASTDSDSSSPSSLATPTSNSNSNGTVTKSASSKSIRRSLVNSNSSGSGSSHSVSLNCRMYSESYPSIDDLVVVQVKSVVEMGAYCSLLEYNNIEGMILMSELSRRRIRSVNKIIRVGRQEIVAVLRVNQEKGKQHTFCLCFICVLCVCKKFLEISDFFSLFFSVFCASDTRYFLS